MKTFRELYCEHHGIRWERYERALLWRCLHWQARPFYWLLWVNHEYYAADFEFIRSVGELSRRSGFHNEAAEFHYHPRNRGFWRSFLRLRVSARRMQEVFEREISASQSVPPQSA